MNSLVEISLASETDVSEIAPISGLAMHDDLLDTFLFGFGRPSAVPEAIFTKAIQDNLKDPLSRVFKASLKNTGEVVGYGTIRFEDGVMEFEDTPWSTPPSVLGPPGSSPVFGEMYRGAIKAKWKQHMRGTPHVVWNSLFVKPEYQRQGIGSELLRWGFATFGLEKHLVWLTTQMRGRNIYRKYGWVDVDHVDVDMSEWGGKLRGFGVHRSPLILRQPGELNKIYGIVEE
ncbi:hypothetical protein MMC30_003316 [Trapelia coarctata]|nr:hypothetical protein [Trapelia coarctata]